MKRLRILYPVWMVCAMVCAMTLGAVAQERSPAQTAPMASATPVASAGADEWVPEGIAALGQKANSRAEFTLDHSMLMLATMLDRKNPDLRRVISGVQGVSVHSFRFADAVVLDPALAASIGQHYQEAGWLHLVKKGRNEGGATTDLWIHMDQASIRGIAVLSVAARQVTFVSASGAVSPLDLLHLSGHYGIPKMDGSIAVPVPGRP